MEFIGQWLVSEAFDRATAPGFGLRVFQQPAGADVCLRPLVADG